MPAPADRGVLIFSGAKWREAVAQHLDSFASSRRHSTMMGRKEGSKRTTLVGLIQHRSRSRRLRQKRRQRW